jgi:hypothetical protein
VRARLDAPIWLLAARKIADQTENHRLLGVRPTEARLDATLLA